MQPRDRSSIHKLDLLNRANQRSSHSKSRFDRGRLEHDEIRRSVLRRIHAFKPILHTPKLLKDFDSHTDGKRPVERFQDGRKDEVGEDSRVGIGVSQTSEKEVYMGVFSIGLDDVGCFVCRVRKKKAMSQNAKHREFLRRNKKTHRQSFQRPQR